MTITTKYAFGDNVRFGSVDGSGTGRVFAITVNADGSTEYLIEIAREHYSDLQPGIVGADIAEKLDDGKIAATHAVATKYSFGDVVRFDSVNGKGTGTVSAIMVDWDKRISYVVKIVGFADLQPGIMEYDVLEKVADGEIGNR